MEGTALLDIWGESPQRDTTTDGEFSGLNPPSNTTLTLFAYIYNV
jgi:hypothetical protein